MPRLSQARLNDRRKALVAAARQAFAEHGYEATSIAGIARRAGVSDGLLYRYFTDKRALLAAVLTQYMEEMVALAKAAVAGSEGFEARLRALIGAQFAAFAEDPDICDLYIRELRDTGAIPAGSPLRKAARTYTDLLVEIVRSAEAAGEIEPGTDPRMIRDLVFGGIEHIAWHSLTGGPPLNVDRLAERLARLVARGIAR